MTLAHYQPGDIVENKAYHSSYSFLIYTHELHGVVGIHFLIRTPTSFSHMVNPEYFTLVTDIFRGYK